MSAEDRCPAVACERLCGPGRLCSCKPCTCKTCIRRRVRAARHALRQITHRRNPRNEAQRLPLD